MLAKAADFLAVAVSLALATPLRAATTWTATVSDPGNLFPTLDATLAYHAELAGETWSQYMPAGKGSIQVEVDIEQVSDNRGGGGSATTQFLKTTHGLSIYEQGAAYEIRTGTDPNGSTPDIYIQLDPDYINTLFIDPDPLTRTDPIPHNKTDDMSVFIHELGHALAFNGWRDWTTGALPASVNYESTFDALVSTVGTVSYFNGADAEGLYGGPVPLTAGNLYHVGNNAPLPGSSLIPDLMNGVVFDYQTRYSISPLDLAVLKDVGLPVSVPEPSSAALALTFAGVLLMRGSRRPRGRA